MYVNPVESSAFYRLLQERVIWTLQETTHRRRQPIDRTGTLKPATLAYNSESGHPTTCRLDRNPAA